MFHHHSPARFTALPALAFLVLSVVFASLFRFLQPAGALLFQFGSLEEYTASDTAGEFIQMANDYLRQTAEILGSQYDEDFYTNSVQRELERFLGGGKSALQNSQFSFEESALFFDTFAPDSNLCEALAFLSELEGCEISIPVAVSIPGGIAGNPINRLTDPLIEDHSVNLSPSEIAPLSRRVLPVTESFALLFSLLSVTASLLTSESPINSLFLFGISPFRKIPALRYRLKFPGLRHSFPVRFRTGYSSVFSQSIIERKTIVLLL